MSDHITDPHASGSDHGLTRGHHSPLRESLESLAAEPMRGSSVRTIVTSEATWMQLAARAEEMDRQIATLTARAEAAEAVAERWRAQTEQARAELERTTREVVAVIETIPGAVRVREGGGPEDPFASLAVSVFSLATRVREAEAQRAMKWDQNRALLRERDALRAAVEGAKRAFDELGEVHVFDGTVPWDENETPAERARAASRTLTAALSRAPGEAILVTSSGETFTAEDLERARIVPISPAPGKVPQKVGHVDHDPRVRIAALVRAAAHGGMRPVPKWPDSISISPTPTPPEEARGEEKCGEENPWYTRNRCALPRDHDGPHDSTGSAPTPEKASEP